MQNAEQYCKGQAAVRTADNFILRMIVSLLIGICFNPQYLLAQPKDPNIIYIDRFRTRDKGRAWTRLKRSVSAISEKPIGRIYALESGVNENTTNIFVSDDDGESWRLLLDSVPVVVNKINKLVLDPHDADRIYLATHKGVLLYDGKSWALKDNKHGLARDQFGLMYVSALVADPSRQGHLIAGKAAPGRGMSNGVFASDDGGESWYSISGNLGDSLYVWSLFLDTWDGVIYAGTDRGLMKLDLDTKGCC